MSIYSHWSPGHSGIESETWNTIWKHKQNMNMICEIYKPNHNMEIWSFVRKIIGNTRNWIMEGKMRFWGNNFLIMGHSLQKKESNFVCKEAYCVMFEHIYIMLLRLVLDHSAQLKHMTQSESKHWQHLIKHRFQNLSAKMWMILK